MADKANCSGRPRSRFDAAEAGARDCKSATDAVEAGGMPAEAADRYSTAAHAEAVHTPADAEQRRDMAAAVHSPAPAAHYMHHTAEEAGTSEYAD